MTGCPLRSRAGALGLAAALFGCLAGVCEEADGLINPGFTPVHVVSQSARVFSLELAGAANGGFSLRLVKCLKGKVPGGALALDVSRTPKGQVEALRKTLGADEGRLALLFSGQYREETPDGALAQPEPDDAGATGLLHVEGRWFRLYQPTPNAPWLLEKLDNGLQATWAGGTDMLLRAVEYVLADPDPAVPVRTGAGWAEKVKVSRVPGRVHGVAVVDLSADGRSLPVLHLLCEGGDRIIQWDAKAGAFADRTAALKLSARSRRATWADVNADGVADLASWDGGCLLVHLRTADGTFAAQARKAALPGGCIGLSALGAGNRGRPGLLVSTASTPVLLVAGADGAFVSTPVVDGPAGDPLPPGLGRALPCMVADFDGDDVADILQPFAGGAMFYRGTKPGRFASPRRCDGISAGGGRAGAGLGDYDADGLFDVFIAGQDGCRLWHNVGGGQFVEALALAGEADYITEPGGIGAQTCDVNGDGRQDVLIVYGTRAPQLFFNRGFRSFGHSHTLDLAERKLLPAAEKGLQAGVVGDLNGDGAQDLVVATTDGQVWAFFRETAGGSVPSLRVAMALDGGVAGPVRVIGWHGRRCLGAWNVVCPAAEAFFARRTKGPVTVQWPGLAGRPRRKKVILLRPVRLGLEGSVPP